ncbi:MAG TPA: phospholipase D-like domain-containing protein [Candidatus Binatia bacterium]|jgi:phosphatidylserine/phosphatidylglycerophosphate/cardiolipin synthase-like enzyme
MRRSLIVMPDDSAEPILAAIAAAKKSLRIKMFLFSHPTLLAAVIAAQKRGVTVRVMLNPARRGGERENEATRKKLDKAGVEVIDSNPAFAVTHEKSMVIDAETAFVKSLNWETKNLTETRDYAVVTSDQDEVEEIIDCFEADWHRKKFDAGKEPRLIWCNYNGRDRIAEFIDRAKYTLFVQNERYQDAVIIERLVRAARRGVKIHVMARPPHTLKKEKLVEGVGGIRILNDVGIKVHKLRHLKLHAKMLLADGKRAIVGSINLSPGSFDSRRELAIEVADKHVVKRLHRVARHDWKHSHPLDLTDEGLMADLEKRAGKGVEKLALNPRSKKAR